MLVADVNRSEIFGVIRPGRRCSAIRFSRLSWLSTVVNPWAMSPCFRRRFGGGEPMRKGKIGNKVVTVQPVYRHTS